MRSMIMRKYMMILIGFILVLFFVISFFFFFQSEKESNIEIDAELSTKIIYSEPSDGFSKYVGDVNLHSWVDVRNMIQGTEAHDDWDKYLKGVLSAYNGKTGDRYIIARSFFSFNTSFLNHNDMILNASLQVFGCGTNESSVCAVAWMDGNDGVDIDDYSQVGIQNFGRTYNWYVEKYNIINLNEAGLKHINTSSFTYFALREYDHDFLNNAPAGNQLDEHRNGHYFSENPGRKKDPYLYIEYKEQTN